MSPDPLQSELGRAFVAAYQRHVASIVYLGPPKTVLAEGMDLQAALRVHRAEAVERAEAAEGMLFAGGLKQAVATIDAAEPFVAELDAARKCLQALGAISEHASNDAKNRLQLRLGEVEALLPQLGTLLPAYRETAAEWNDTVLKNQKVALPLNNGAREETGRGPSTRPPESAGEPAEGSAASNLSPVETPSAPEPPATPIKMAAPVTAVAGPPPPALAPQPARPASEVASREAHRQVTFELARRAALTVRVVPTGARLVWGTDPGCDFPLQVVDVTGKQPRAILDAFLAPQQFALEILPKAVRLLNLTGDPPKGPRVFLMREALFRVPPAGVDLGPGSHELRLARTRDGRNRPYMTHGALLVPPEPHRGVFLRRDDDVAEHVLLLADTLDLRSLGLTSHSLRFQAGKSHLAVFEQGSLRQFPWGQSVPWSFGPCALPGARAS
ncbi:MAG: hypothetical protein ACFB21_15195 [Opitutales bacterium]